MMPSFVTGVVTASLALLGSTEARPSAATAPVQAQTEYGPVTGSTDGAVNSWLGIPVATAERWKAPQPPKPWTSFAADTPFLCTQNMEGSVIGSEGNCLRVNVWAAAATAQKPANTVLVWIHGGGNSFTSPPEVVFNGRNLVLGSGDDSVIVVDVGYRLGGLGFMAMPELTAESPHNSSGNYGMLDQINALRWIRDNIKHFGAVDSPRVTIAGESAGAYDIAALLGSPLATGLFDGAIMESTYHAYRFYNLSVAEEVGTDCATKCLANPNRRSTETDPLACLRALPDAEAYACQMGIGPGTVSIDHNLFHTMVVPNVDGYVLMCDPLAAMSATGSECGDLPENVPVIVGASQFEGYLFAGELLPIFGPMVEPGKLALVETFGLTWQSIAEDYGFSGDISASVLAMIGEKGMALYASDSSAAGRAAKLRAGYGSTRRFNSSTLDALMTETYVQFMDTFSDTMFLCSAYFTASRYVQRYDTWLYLFTQTPSTPSTGFFNNLGPVHTSEIPYLFGAFENYTTSAEFALDHQPPWTPDAAEQALSKSMMAYWLEFARTGDPNPSSGSSSVNARVAWPQVDPTSKTVRGYMNFSSTLTPVTDAPYWHEAQCEFWMGASTPPL